MPVTWCVWAYNEVDLAGKRSAYAIVPTTSVPAMIILSAHDLKRENVFAVNACICTRTRVKPEYLAESEPSRRRGAICQSDPPLQSS